MTILHLAPQLQTRVAYPCIMRRYPASSCSKLRHAFVTVTPAWLMACLTLQISFGLLIEVQGVQAPRVAD